MEMGEWRMGLCRGRIWGCWQSGQRKRTEEETEEEEERKRKKRRRNKQGKMSLLRLLTVSLEDLRLLMLEARLVLMDLKEAFFWGSGSALPLFLS